MNANELSGPVATRLRQLAAGLPGMLESAEAIAAFVKATAENREPEHDAEEVAEWAEDLCADIASVESELGDLLGDEPEAVPA